MIAEPTTGGFCCQGCGAIIPVGAGPHACLHWCAECHHAILAARQPVVRSPRP